MKRPHMISPELLERIVDASEDGIVVAEQEGDENILIYVNQGFERLTGYSADEIAALVRTHMEGAFTLDVPLTVDVGVGPDWKSAKP